MSATYRYFRLKTIVCGSGALEITEVRFKAGGTRVAATSVSSSAAPDVFTVANLNDDSVSTRAYWGTTSGLTLTFDFGSSTTLDTVDLAAYDTVNRYPSSFDIEGSNDNSGYTPVGSYSSLTYPGDQIHGTDLTLSGAVTGSGAVSYSGTASGQGYQQFGAGAATYQGTASGSGVVAPIGSGAATYQGTASGVGYVTPFGVGAVTYTGTASGVGTHIRFYEGITESAAAADPQTTEATLYDAIKEIVLGAANTDVSASMTISVNEAATAIETLIGGKLFQEALTEAATGDTSSLVELSFAMLEQAQASETSSSQWVVTMTVAEAVTALALVSTGYGFDVIETADASDAASQYVTMLASLLEEATATDTPTEGLSITVTAQETAAGMDSTETLATLLENLTEDAVGAVTLRLGDDVFTGWLLNAEENAVSEFQHYDFNSFCQLRGEYFAAGADGIYRLGGTSDAGEAIVGYLKTGLLDFGSSLQKRMDSAWLAVATDGTVRLKVVTSDQGVVEETWYEAISTDGGAMAENVRLKIGKGLKSRHWQFELVVENATEFELEEMQLVPLILSRRSE